MPAPSKVEFPGQKKNQRMRMRGTKQASADAQKRLGKQLKRLLDEPEKAMPDMVWEGKLPWGKTDPVTRSLRDMRKVITHRTDRRWLARRMVSKKGDGVAKALAGSLVAAIDEDIGMVATFKHPVYGNGAFVRKGDAKPAGMVGIQHNHNPRLRLLPWEEHAKRGWWFFSWKGGFICTGNQPSVPTEWVADSLSRSAIKIKSHDSCHIIGDLDPEDVRKSSGEGYIRLAFKDGSILGIEGEVFSEVTAKDAFIQPFALGMLPPKVSEIVDAELIWRPEGWDDEMVLPEPAKERVGEVFSAWLGLGLPENHLWGMLKQALLANLEEGFVVGDSWFRKEDVESCLDSFTGGDEERKACRRIIELLHEEGRGIAVDSEGEPEWLDEVGIIRSRSTTMHNFLKACWAEFGFTLLTEMGLDEDSASASWQKQLDKPVPFNNFLRKVVAEKNEADRIGRLPWHDVSLEGLCGELQSLVIKAARDGLGKANSMAKKMRSSIEVAAVGWAWLSAHGKEGGNEWHFEQAARDKGGEWSPAVKSLWEVACGLMDCNSEDVDSRAEEYIASMKAFRTACGEQRVLPS